MPAKPRPTPRTKPWEPVRDTADRYSTGIPQLDTLLGGGFRRGSLALFHLDGTTETADRELLLTPTLLNFLYQSNGVMAVLPSRESPAEFRAHLTNWASRRLFDTRVRVIEYVGEGEDSPYVVRLPTKSGTAGPEKARRAERSRALLRMETAERAVRGARSRMFVEMVAFEMAEMIAGPEVAARMFLYGIKRTRTVGNLCLGLLRPGLACSEAVRAMADVELALHRGASGLTLRGLRPAFPDQVVGPDPRLGAPHVTLTEAR